jgi:hypothetical protein
MRHICQSWGAGRLPLWRSPTLELQVEKRYLGSLILADPSLATQVAPCGGCCVPVRSFSTPGRLPLSSMVTGRCPDARSSNYISSSAVTARHLFRQPDISKQLLGKNLSDIVNFWVAVGHPFLTGGGKKEAPKAPVVENVTHFNPAGHPSMARGGSPFSPPCALRAHTINQALGAQGK